MAYCYICSMTVCLSVCRSGVWALQKRLRQPRWCSGYVLRGEQETMYIFWISYTYIKTMWTLYKSHMLLFKKVVTLEQTTGRFNFFSNRLLTGRLLAPAYSHQPIACTNSMQQWYPYIAINYKNLALRFYKKKSSKTSTKRYFSSKDYLFIYSFIFSH